MPDEQAELMLAVRESYEWLLQWLEDAVSNRPDADQAERQMQLNFDMQDRAQQSPPVAAAAAVGAATAAAMLLRIIADNDPAVAHQLVQQMRDGIDNTSTSPTPATGTWDDPTHAVSREQPTKPTPKRKPAGQRRNLQDHPGGNPNDHGHAYPRVANFSPRSLKRSGQEWSR